MLLHKVCLCHIIISIPNVPVTLASEMHKLIIFTVQNSHLLNSIRTKKMQICFSGFCFKSIYHLQIKSYNGPCKASFRIQSVL